MHPLIRAAAFAVAVALGAPGAVAAAPAHDISPIPAHADHSTSVGADSSNLDWVDAVTASGPITVLAAAVDAVAVTARHAVAMTAGEPLTNQRSLSELVTVYGDAVVTDEQQDCLANAVYFEARSEPIEGQLAVAEVVLNRAASGRYPATICEVVTQPAQFSFIRRGQFPKADRNCEAWRKAVAIARIARERLIHQLPANVLWYHATYVSPSWGKRLSRTTQIGLHIFYS